MTRISQSIWIVWSSELPAASFSQVGKYEERKKIKVDFPDGARGTTYQTYKSKIACNYLKTRLRYNYVFEYFENFIA